MTITVLLILVILMGLTVDYMKNKNMLSPMYLMGGIWLVICCLAMFNSYGYEGINEKSAFMVLCGMIGFIVGGNVVNIFLARRKKDCHKTVKFNIKFLYIILVLVSVGCTIFFVSSAQSLLQGNTYTDVRANLLGYTDDGINDSSVLNLYISFFCGPALTALIPIAIMWGMKRKHMLYCLGVIYSVIVYIISTGGRIMLFYSSVEILIALFFYKNRIGVKAKRRIHIIVGFAAVAALYLTAVRTNSNTLSSLYQYFTIPLSLMSEYSSVVDTSHFYALGGALLYPVMYFINMLFTIFGYSNEYMSDLTYLVGLPQEMWIGGIFPDRVFNAFSTIFYYSYMNFRFWGIIFELLLLGVFFQYIFRKAFVERDEYYLVWYMLLSQLLVGSFVRWQLTPYMVVSIVIVFIACKSERLEK